MSLARSRLVRGGCSLLVLCCLASPGHSQTSSPILYYGKSCGVELSGRTRALLSGLDLELRIRAPFPHAIGLLVVGAKKVNVSLPVLACPLLADPLFVRPYATDKNGDALLRMAAPKAKGMRAYLQALLIRKLQPSLGLDASRGMDLGLDRPSLVPITEDFTNGSQLDAKRSGAVWQNGKLRPGVLGGTGLLGDFDYRLAKDLKTKDAKNRDVYELNTDAALIPATHSLNGREIRITDGNFSFTSFDIPSTVRLRFTGKHPVRLRIGGSCKIDGVLSVSAPLLSRKSSNLTKGWPGGIGGPGGGTGGDGGDRPTLSAGNRNGRKGGVGYISALHPRKAKLLATVGQGSLGNPTTGLSVIWINIASTPVFCRQTAAGGGGAGYWSVVPATGGLASKVGSTSYAYVSGEFGTPTKGAPPFPIFPVLATESSQVMFAIGGSGGGGGGADPFNSFNPTISWSAGGSGGGGGGVLVLRAGNRVDLAKQASIEARGADGLNFGSPFSPPYPAPGGGGAGGSILIQSSAAESLLGSVDVRGGNGGVVAEKSYLGMESVGGNGGAGFVRVESAAALQLKNFQGFQPAARAENLGSLRSLDHEAQSLATSRFYAAPFTGTPTWSHYVIDAKIGGLPVRYSDDPTISKRAASSGEPVVFHAQSTEIDPKTGLPKRSGTNWTEGSLTALDKSAKKGNGIRFAIRLDRSVLAPATSIEVTRVQIFVSQ